MFLLRNKKNMDTFWSKKCLIKSYDGMLCRSLYTGSAFSTHLDRRLSCGFPSSVPYLPEVFGQFCVSKQCRLRAEQAKGGIRLAGACLPLVKQPNTFTRQ